MSALAPPPWPAIDWAAPWFQPWAAFGRPAEALVAAGQSVAQALDAVRPGPPAFVPAQALPAGLAYETFVHDSGTVPSREHLHDFLNGVAWCVYPATKRRLNQWQAAAIARDGIGARRGPLRDAITLFDENGAVFSAPPALAEALRRRDWQALFVGHRALWPRARLWLFGHALVEKLQAPRKDITAHVLCAPEGLAGPAGVDAWLCAALDESRLAAKPFSPLPVLGVPGWWPANAERAFYDDTGVFRPSRSVRA